MVSPKNPFHLLDLVNHMNSVTDLQVEDFLKLRILDKKMYQVMNQFFNNVFSKIFIEETEKNVDWEGLKTHLEKKRKFTYLDVKINNFNHNELLTLSASLGDIYHLERKYLNKDFHEIIAEISNKVGHLKICEFAILLNKEAREKFNIAYPAYHEYIGKRIEISKNYGPQYNIWKQRRSARSVRNRFFKNPTTFCIDSSDKRLTLPSELIFSKLESLRIYTCDMELNSKFHSIFKISTLTELLLCTDLSKSPSIDLSALTKLKRLSLSDNKLKNFKNILFPNSIEDFKISFYKDLDLNSELEFLLDFENLKELHLQYNALEAIPNVVYKLINLTKLDVSHNKKIVISKEILNLLNLKSLKMENNELKAIPDVVYKLINLTKLDVSHNKKIVISKEILNLLNLKSLKMEENELKAIPDIIYQMDKIEKVDLLGNHITHVSTKISQLKHLKSLNLKYNYMKEIPNILWKMPKDINIKLSGQSLYSPKEDIHYLDKEYTEKIKKLNDLTKKRAKEFNDFEIRHEKGNEKNYDRGIHETELSWQKIGTAIVVVTIAALALKNPK